jgi:YidC/Oxa1 family membrane protein insertase
MDIYAFGPIATILDGAYALFVAINTFILPIAGSSSAAVAVVLLTVLVRAFLVPVGVSQVRADAIRRRLAPQIAELRRRYRTDPELLQRRIQELYAAAKASPTAGCLPMLAQAPVLSILYGLFTLPSIGGHPNMLLAEDLVGVPLGAAFAEIAVSGTLAWESCWPFLVAMSGIALVAYASRRLLIATSLDAEAPPAGDPRALAAISRAVSFAPFLTAVVAAFAPLAAAIYLLVTVTWTLVERLILRRVCRQ